ncbi:MAG: spore germination protein GerW family protein [Candidatus Aquicultorales bacterium]
MADDKLSEIIDKLSAALGSNGGAQLVFGETRMVGEKAIIPVAKVGYGFGGGGGTGKAPQAETGEGAGFGGGINLKPVGFIEITPAGVVYRPVFDLTALLTTGLVIIGVLATKCMVLSACRRKHRYHKGHGHAA